MELRDAARRILGQHPLLILVFVLLGIGLAALFHGGGTPTYTASTRLVLDTQDPKSSAESKSIADTARAIATSPFQVSEALNDARVTNRDPVELANHHVSIRALGTSGVLQLSVSDGDPRVATAVSNTLAARVIRTRVNVRNGQIQEVLKDLDQRIDELNRRIASADEAKRDSLVQQRGVLESERVSLRSNDALRLKPSIISPAAQPRHADSSRWLPYLTLGALLGLVLAIGSAGLMETLRPTLVGGDAVAREFDVPLLGSLRFRLSEGWDDDRSRADLQAISLRLRLAAETAGLKNLALLATTPGPDVEALAEQLEAGALADRSPLCIRPFSPEDASTHDPDETGLVLISPNTIKKTELEDVNHLLRVMPLHALGLITYSPGRGSQGASSRATLVMRRLELRARRARAGE